MTSHNFDDFENGFCGNCDEYTSLSDGFVRAFLKKHELDSSPEHVVGLLQEWLNERNAPEIEDWLPKRLGIVRT